MTEAESEATKVALMQQQVQTLVDAMNRIERKVDEVVSLDRVIFGMQSDYKHQSEEMKTQWARIDGAIERIGETERKVDKWVNTARGSWITLIILGSLVQAAIAGSVAWVFSNVQELRERAAVVESKVRETDRSR